VVVVAIDTPALGDRSYLVHDGEVAMVIDPQTSTTAPPARAWCRSLAGCRLCLLAGELAADLVHVQVADRLDELLERGGG